MPEKYRIVGLEWNRDTGDILQPPKLTSGRLGIGGWSVNDDIRITVDDEIIVEDMNGITNRFQQNVQRCREDVGEPPPECTPIPEFLAEPDISEVRIEAFNTRGTRGSLRPIAIQHVATGRFLPLVEKLVTTSQPDTKFLDLTITAPPPSEIPPPQPCTVNTFLQDQGIGVEMPVVGETPCILALLGGMGIGITLLVVD